MLARVAHGAAAHGYLVDDEGSVGGGRRAAVAAGSAAARRAGVRMENVFYVQNHFKAIPPARMRTAVHQGMALLDLPVKDRLEAGWALHTSPTGGGGFGGRGQGGIGPAAKADRVVANSTRSLVAELLKGVVGGVPEGLSPPVPDGHAVR